MKHLLGLTALSVATLAGAAPASDVSMFPKASSGMTRNVIRLAPRADEKDWKVEFRVGKQQKIDCNHHGLGDNLVRKDLQGWGYDYWEARATPMMTTLMGCPPGSAKTAFVAGTPQLVRYNSKLPLVVYAPKGHEVRYRLWSVAAPEQAATKG